MRGRPQDLKRFSECGNIRIVQSLLTGKNQLIARLAHVYFIYFNALAKEGYIFKYL